MKKCTCKTGQVYNNLFCKVHGSMHLVELNKAEDIATPVPQPVPPQRPKPICKERYKVVDTELLEMMVDGFDLHFRHIELKHTNKKELLEKILWYGDWSRRLAENIIKGHEHKS